VSDNSVTALEVVSPKQGFSKRELTQIQQYVDDVGHVPLPPLVVEKLFEQYLGGSSLLDITKQYPEYTKEAILYSAWKYDWPAERDMYVTELQSRMRQRVMHSKFQQLELVSNMIRVAHVEANQAMQAYLKHPCDRNTPKILRIKSIKELHMAIEMMSMITGQDNNKNLTVNGEVSVNNENVSTDQKSLNSELAEQLLKQIAAGNISVKES
jgi:hypothetical protein